MHLFFRQFPKKMPVPKVLVVLDFDHTIVDDNSDTRVWNLLPGKNVPQDIKNSYKDHKSWTAYMADIFLHLHTLGVQKKDIVNCFRDIPFTPGMLEFLKYQEKAPSVDTIIASDANSFFISCIMEGVGLANAYKEIFTNPAEFDDEGCLKIQHHHQHDCPRCAVNMCKGTILKDYIARMRQSNGIEYDRVLFVGDGGNDFCPCLALGERDFVFPRKGYKLIQKIEKYNKESPSDSEPHQKLRATVVPWDNAREILNCLQGIVEG
ncbi:pyridoxal phosphate phosphatase PHOSPHO2-like [Asterias rubens]|uniref:pyridoxal phosphate phosphatase PHOSPHO2-like n=1 Tax=Asterias rubens TaxID=7604 RepID=UPI001454FE5A|nr:pyridoxal phosphate phosphatase PHOSPHO2-like [Asterias rubens]